tara:strand:- start:701 stop:1426 length:726 start_codon:yes stop_codon:yes gene_type:complete
MVNIDTIYQRVLALANKEQRGYITPQEFNLFANQAQMDIFEQYFYDIKQFHRNTTSPGNDTEFSDPLYILNEKLNTFEVERDPMWTSDPSNLGLTMNLPEEIYRLGTVKLGLTQVEILSSKEFDAARLSYLTSPTLDRPIACIVANRLNIATGPDTFVNAIDTDINISYMRRPNAVNWGYVVVNQKAMWDPTNTNHFELHPSEQGELTSRILAFAGINLKQGELTQVAATTESQRIQNEKQ